MYLHGSTTIGVYFAAIECSTISLSANLTGKHPSGFLRFCSPSFVSDYETLTLVRLPYYVELIGCIRVQGYASI